jgi:hypothetical protein
LPIVSLLKKPAAVPQSKSFGGSNGPYIGTGFPSVKAPVVPHLGILQDPSVPGQSIGDYSPIPTVPGLGTPPPVDNGGGGDGGGGGGGGPVDPYAAQMAQILGHPLAQSALAAYTNALSANRGNLRGQIQSAIIQSGYLPDMQGDLAGYADDLDQLTRERTLGNQTSQKALLDKAVSSGLTRLSYDLASRGTGSGGRGGGFQVGSRTIEDQAALARSQQMAALTDAIRGGIGGYNQQSLDARTAYDNALFGVAGLLANQPSDPAGGGGGGGSDGTGATDPNAAIGVNMPAVGELVPPGYAPLGSTVAANGGGSNYVVGGIPINSSVPVPKSKKKK